MAFGVIPFLNFSRAVEEEADCSGGSGEDVDGQDLAPFVGGPDGFVVGDQQRGRHSTEESCKVRRLIEISGLQRLTDDSTDTGQNSDVGRSDGEERSVEARDRESEESGDTAEKDQGVVGG